MPRKKKKKTKPFSRGVTYIVTWSKRATSSNLLLERQVGACEACADKGVFPVSSGRRDAFSGDWQKQSPSSFQHKAEGVATSQVSFGSNRTPKIHVTDNDAVSLRIVVNVILCLALHALTHIILIKPIRNIPPFHCETN